jgi:hypothetical protein
MARTGVLITLFRIPYFARQPELVGVSKELYSYYCNELEGAIMYKGNFWVYYFKSRQAVIWLGSQSYKFKF